MNNFEQNCMVSSSSIQSVASHLNKNKIKTVYILDEEKKLVGSVTDGDLRRGIINGINFNSTITEVMNKSPRFADSKTSENAAIELMNNLFLETIPIVNANMEIVKILYSHKSKSKYFYDNPVVIMAGGFGTRLMPLTKTTPKPMLTVRGKPIIEHIIERFIAQGFHQFYISVHYKADQIISYFGDGSSKNISVKYLSEEEPLGTAGGLSLLPLNENELPIILTNADILTNTDFNSMLFFHDANKADMTMCVRNISINVPYGVATLDGAKLTNLDEKPNFDYTINAGIYVLNPEIIRMIKPEKINITDIIDLLIHSNKLVYCFPLFENWVDIGHYDELKRVQEN